jgi:predicted transcriptional regulator
MSPIQRRIVEALALEPLSGVELAPRIHGDQIHVYRCLTKLRHQGVIEYRGTKQVRRRGHPAKLFGLSSPSAVRREVG